MRLELDRCGLKARDWNRGIVAMLGSAIEEALLVEVKNGSFI